MVTFLTQCSLCIRFVSPFAYHFCEKFTILKSNLFYNT